MEDQEVDNQRGYEDSHNNENPSETDHCYDVKRRPATQQQNYRDHDVERGEINEEVMKPRNYHDRYSYAGYEPEREFKDYAREREMMLQRQRERNSYTARYEIWLLKVDEVEECSQNVVRM